MFIRRELEELDKKNQSVKVGIVGMGAMGAGTLHAMHNMAGLKTLAIADLNIDRVLQALELDDIPKEKITISNHKSICQDEIRKGKIIVTEDALLLPQLDIDVVLEATGSEEFGARVAYESIQNRKHIVMLNVETDVVVGPILNRLAKSANVVYTLAAGDQPGAILEMYHWATSLGFEIIAAGRGNVRYPDDRYAPPKKNDRGSVLNPYNIKMANSFLDGTKSQIEMAAVANATGLLPEIRGMHEPQVGFHELAEVFALKKDGGILEKKGAIEIANAVNKDGVFIEEGSIGRGVFLVVDSSHPEVKKYLNQFFRSERVSTGEALFRPYHLTCLETPISIARAAIYGQETCAPIKLFTEVISVAKRNIKVGEILDGGGGEMVYGLVELAEIANKEDLLPLGFAENIEVKNPIQKDHPIKNSDVEVNKDSFLYKIRKLQDMTC